MALKYNNIYVAATSQHVGKTTTTLGLTAAYQSMGLNVGYCKPVGQKYLGVKNIKVDKDCILFSDLIGFDMDPKIHSPVILPKGATKNYLENPDAFDYEADILMAKKYRDAHDDITIYEGTGHTGVGSVVDLSNAKVAKMLNAGVVMVIEGGIGKTIDMLNMTTALFREENVPLLGVIINKVVPDKLENVRKYVSIWLERRGIPLLGIAPYDQILAYPLLSTVCKSLKGEALYFGDKLDNRVENMLAGSLVDLKGLRDSQNILLVASSSTVDRALNKVKSYSKHSEVNDSPLVGLVVTGKVDLKEESLNYIQAHKIPVITSHFDTYGAVTKINSIEVKINRRTPWKVKRAISMVQRHVDLDKILALSLK
ncbi:MAG: AAA family ATPase [Saprospiraceae bacterium]